MDSSLLGLPLEKLSKLNALIPDNYAFSNELLFHQISSWSDQYGSLAMSINYKHICGLKKSIIYPLSSLSLQESIIFKDIESMNSLEYQPYDITVGRLVKIEKINHFLPFDKLENTEKDILAYLFTDNIAHSSADIAQELNIPEKTAELSLHTLRNKGYTLVNYQDNMFYWLARYHFIISSGEQKKKFV
jgi:biotin operon repressor